MSFVLDASVTLAWCFEDKQTRPVMALLDKVTETGATAPLLWPIETLNVRLTAERRIRLDPAGRIQVTGFLRELPVRLDQRLGDHAWGRLADQYRLTTYDAAYLELAERRKLPLASLDPELRTAARAFKMEMLG